MIPNIETPQHEATTIQHYKFDVAFNINTFGVLFLPANKNYDNAVHRIRFKVQNRICAVGMKSKIGFYDGVSTNCVQIFISVGDF